MRIGIIGGGTVGRATARTWLEHCEEVRVWDKLKERGTSHSLGEICKCDLVFICLPETELDTLFSDNAGFDTKPPIPTNFVLKSTVPIGTTRRLREQYGLTNLVHSPEFLTARCAAADAQLPSQLIIGGPYDYDNKCCQGLRVVSQLLPLYRRRFPGVPIREMSSDESEAVKLFTNSFFAVKVAYFNEISSLAEKLGLDWQRVIEGMLGDGRIAHSHTKVPGPDGKYGFGGACLPKDLAMLWSTIDRAGLPMDVTYGAWARNDDVDRRREVKK
jgi:UDP-glucose 6-dehydrogenase